MRTDALIRLLAVAAMVVAAAPLASCGGTRRSVNPGIRERARTLEEASHETALRGDLPRAVVLEERAVDAYRSIDDVEAVAAGLNRLGNLRQRDGDLAGAQRAYREAAELARPGAAIAEEAAAENNLGTLCEVRGDVAGARSHYQKALSLAEQAEAPAVEAAALNNLGLLDLAEGASARARARFEEALAIDRAQDDRAGEATRLRNLGTLHRRGGDSAAALASFEQAHEIDRERQDVPAIALDLVFMSEARATGGVDLVRAVGERRRAHEIHRLLGDEVAAARDREQLAVWCARLSAAAPTRCVPGVDETH